MKILILIPTLNEEQGIESTIEGIPRDYLKELGHDAKIILIDGHSSDHTLDFAKKNGADIFVQNGRGKGTGVRQVLDKAINGDWDYLFMLDGDATYPGHRIVDMVKELSNGNDVVIGSRLNGYIEPGAMTPLNKMGNKAISMIASTLYAKHVSDVCTGMWGFNRASLQKLPLNSTHFELEAELFAESAKHKLKIKEIPIEYYRREGETKLIPMKTGFEIVSKLIRRRIKSPGSD